MESGNSFSVSVDTAPPARFGKVSVDRVSTSVSARAIRATYTLIVESLQTLEASAFYLLKILRRASFILADGSASIASAPGNYSFRCNHNWLMSR